MGTVSDCTQLYQTRIALLYNSKIQLLVYLNHLKLYLKRFKIFKELQNGNCYKVSNYLLIVKNPCIRKVISRLRINMNNLNECINRQIPAIDKMCEHCNMSEDVEHFLFTCEKFTTIRQLFYDKVSPYNDFNSLST